MGNLGPTREARAAALRRRVCVVLALVEARPRWATFDWLAARCELDRGVMRRDLRELERNGLVERRERRYHVRRREMRPEAWRLSGETASLASHAKNVKET